MEGFIVFDHRKHYAEARKQLAQWLAEGKIKRQETIVKGGLRVAEQALVDLFKGGNTGEYLIAVDCKHEADFLQANYLWSSRPQRHRASCKDILWWHCLGFFIIISLLNTSTEPYLQR